MYNPHQKREAFLLNNINRAWAALAGIRNPDCQVQDYYGNPKVWTKEKTAPRHLVQVPDGGGQGTRYYTVLVPSEPNELIEG